MRVGPSLVFLAEAELGEISEVIVRRRRHWSADFENDRRVILQRNRSRVTGELRSIDERRDVAAAAGHVVRRQGLSPNVKKLPKGIRLGTWSLDVNRARRIVGMEPVKATPGNSDLRRNRHRLAIGDDRQVGMDVIGKLLTILAGNAIHHLTASTRGTFDQAGQGVAQTRRESDANEREHHDCHGHEHRQARTSGGWRYRATCRALGRPHWRY